MAFVVAWKSGNKQISYRDPAGKVLIQKGGSRSWRNNNPGNIIKGSFANNHGAIGDDGKMAVFPDETVGRGAVKALLTGNPYGNLSIHDAMYRYAPPSDGNDTDAYIAAITMAVGVAAGTIINNLSAPQLDVFVGAIKKHEGWITGETIQPGAGVPAMAMTTAMAGIGGIDPRIQKLLEIAATAKRCEELRSEARKAMVQIYGKITSKNACAATLSIFLREAGFPFAKIEFGAGNLARYIEKTLKWRRLAVGQQQPGDVGVCFDRTAPAGADHIFFVTTRVDEDEMMIVDNQESYAPHPRFASGHGKTAVEYFLTLRPAAGGPGGPPLSAAFREVGVEIDDTVVTEDQDTNDLVPRYTADGKPLD